MENKRLTEKVKNTDDYIKLPTKDKQEFINKLGQVEDLMEKYKIESIEELEDTIQIKKALELAFAKYKR